MRCRTVYLHAHHIYAKKKLREIPLIARRLSLRGFLLSGKPGYIGIQGEAANVARFLTALRRMSWQSLEMRFESEEAVCTCVGGVSGAGCYDSFDIIGSPPGQKSNLRDLSKALRPSETADKRKILETIVKYEVKDTNAL